MLIFAISSMESSKGKESGEMHSPDKQGQYAPEVAAPEGMLHFSVQGLVDVLMIEVSDVQLLLSVEFTLQLEVMMADYPGHPHPPAISWNVGIVMHILKSDPMLRDLKHVQVDGLRMAYLFFFDKQTYLQSHPGYAETCQRGIHGVDFLLCLFCYQPASSCRGVVPRSSGIQVM